MLIGSIGSRNFVTRSGILGQNSSSTTTSKSSAAQRVGVKDFMTRLVTAGEAIQKLKADFSDVRAGSGRKIKARTVGDTKVALDTNGSASTLSSSEEISTLTTAVDNRNPEWGKAKSLATVTVHGTYAGTSDAEYTVATGNSRGFQIGKNSTYRLFAYKDGVRIANITIPKKYKEGTQLEIDPGSGLYISFTEENITKKDSFTFNALANVDVTADPDEAFDGSTGGYTNLDSSVSAGTFEVNGTTITVNDTDTINTVVDSINSSGAGVTAAYDAAADSLSLTSNALGANTITVGSDTSGFLAAMKLDTATTSLGQGDQRTLAFDEVSFFSGVSSGSFEINGVSISVDVTTDTLNDLISRVNDSEADAVMSYSATTDRLSIRSSKNDQELTVQNDSTGLFTTFGVEEGTSDPKKSRGLNSGVIQDMMKQITEMVELINQMSATVANESTIGGGAKTARNHMRSEMADIFGVSSDTIDTGFGMTLNVAEDSSKSFIELGSLGERELERALKRKPREVLESLFGTNDKDGLVQGVLNGLNRAQTTMTNRYGSVGLILDVTA